MLPYDLSMARLAGPLPAPRNLSLPSGYTPSPGTKP